MTNRITADYLTDKYISTESLFLYSEGYFILKIEIASVSSLAYTSNIYSFQSLINRSEYQKIFKSGSNSKLSLKNT
jgi:hypothetical protein